MANTDYDLYKIICPHCSEINTVSTLLTPKGSPAICGSCARVFEVPQIPLFRVEAGSTENAPVASSQEESYSFPEVILSDTCKNIMLIDKDLSTVRLYTAEIEDYFEGKVKMLSFKLGQEGLQFLKAKNDKIDIIVCEIGLEDIDGIKVLRKCKELYPSIPFIINTCYDYRDDLETWNADAYIIKSSDLSELCSTIKGLLNKK